MLSDIVPSWRDIKVDVVRVMTTMQIEIAADETILDRLDLTKDEFEELMLEENLNETNQLLKKSKSITGDSDDVSEGFVNPYDTSNPVG